MAIPSKTFLIVDPDAATRDLLTDLVSQWQCDAVLAEDAAQASDILSTAPVDFVIIEADLPDRPTADFIADIHKYRRDLPIVVLTHHHEHAASGTFRGVGAVDVLAKPINLHRLYELVRRTFEKRERDRRRRLDETSSSLRVIGGYRVVDSLGNEQGQLTFLVNKDDKAYLLRILPDVELPGGVEGKDRHHRFKRGAVVASSVAHPNVIRIVDFGISEEEGLPYIVTEYIAGRTLDLYARETKGQLDYADKVRLLRQVADALAAVHDKGIVSREIRPASILVTDEGRAVLTHFGFAHTPSSTLTVPGAMVGEPDYMAPESGQTDPTPATDVFALGVVAYEFLLGRKPFFSPSLPELTQEIRHAKPKQPRKVDPAFPADLEPVLARMLKKEPGERHPDAKVVRADFDRFLAGDLGGNRGLAGLISGLFVRDWS